MVVVRCLAVASVEHEGLDRLEMLRA
jgi:hypothetical protein